MKVKDVTATFDYTGDTILSFKLPKGYEATIQEILAIDKADIPNYELNFLKTKKKRSLDANAYCWVLCKRIADVLGSTDKEIYQEMIIRYGVWEIIPVKEQKIEEKLKLYERQGIGGHAIDMGECSALDGYHNVKRWYGSSTYDSKQMSVFIDGIVSECKEIGVEIMTPTEINRLKGMWRK